MCHVFISTSIFFLLLFSCLQGATTLKDNIEDLTRYHADFQQLLQDGALNLSPEFDLEPGKAGAVGPWSYEPVCTEKIEAIGSQLCVYTNTTFSGGRGISLFTTPRIADEVVALLTLHDQDAPADLAADDPEGARNWYTRSVPGKGLGMHAKTALRRGDLVAAYTPVLIAYSETFLEPTEREKWLRLAVDQLPVRTRDQYVQLATINQDKAPPMLVQDIASANSFGVQLGGVAHLAVFPETSRINHDCAPNAQFRLDESVLTQWVRAARPIAQDDEITIAYYSPLETYARRQKYLQDAFHFTCRCARCRRGQAADAALEEIEALQEILGDWKPRSEKESKAGGVKQAERLIQLYKDQGLDGFLDPAYCHAALTYNAVGSVRGAKRYVELALEAIRLRLGDSAPDLPQWKEMLADPTTHWSWRRRKSS